VAERRRRVLTALATLPPDQRAALVLVDMEGYPVSEVAEMLGCAEGTVKSRCSRGRTKLAGLLLDLHEPPGEPPHGNPHPEDPVQRIVRPRGPPAP
jgi:RNA polymerase sigma-70 factor (ECF subfamily)